MVELQNIERVSLDEIRNKFEQNDWYLAGIVTVTTELHIEPIKSFTKGKGRSIIERDRARCCLSFSMPDSENITNGIFSLANWLEYSGDRSEEHPLKADIIRAFSLNEEVLPYEMKESITLTLTLPVHLFMVHPDVEDSNKEEGEIWDYLHVEVAVPSDEVNVVDDDSHILRTILAPEYIADETTEEDVDHVRLDDVIKALKLDIQAKIWECETC